jgi:hypothetical protein
MLFSSVLNACLGNRGLALLQHDGNHLRAFASRVAWPVPTHRAVTGRPNEFKRLLSGKKSIQASIMPVINSKIEVSDLEQQIFDELLEVVYAEDLKTTLRCAGGWVRDKLMGKLSLDIDIALDNMLGREFAERVNQHLKSKVRHN